MTDSTSKTQNNSLKETKDKSLAIGIGIGMTFGMMLGIGWGIATENMMLWIGIGIGIGAMFGLIIGFTMRRKAAKVATSEESSDDSQSG
jgi:F0F1-type ATP synthase assembly protein I